MKDKILRVHQMCGRGVPSRNRVMAERIDQRLMVALLHLLSRSDVGNVVRAVLRMKSCQRVLMYTMTVRCEVHLKRTISVAEVPRLLRDGSLLE